MGRRANIVAGVVQEEVLEVDKFAVEAQRSASVGEVHALDPAPADRRADDALVDTYQRRCPRALRVRGANRVARADRARPSVSCA